MTVSNTANILRSTDIINAIVALDEARGAKEKDINTAQDEITEICERLKDLAEKNDSGEIAQIDNLIEACEDDILGLKGYIETLLADIQDINEEVEPMRDFADMCECNCPDWHHDETLIHDDYFQQYAEQIADDCCDMDNTNWPFCHIDWEAAADALKQDYSAAEFDGETYWMR